MNSSCICILQIPSNQKIVKTGLSSLPLKDCHEIDMMHDQLAEIFVGSNLSHMTNAKIRHKHRHAQVSRFTSQRHWDFCS